jgi:hypothetical protein
MVPKSRYVKSKELTAEELERFWDDLAAEDAARGQAAVWSLVDAPAQAIALFKVRLRPDRGPNQERLRRLIANLDSNDFNVREAAAQDLQRFGEEAEPAIREALGRRPTPESQRRLEAILSAPRVIRLPEVLRHVRAVQVLERIGSSKAREVLEMLAKGVPEARLTRDVQASLKRLAQRPAGLP